MRRVGIVFLGGGLGACLRAMLAAWLAPVGATIPILLVNLMGACALGVVFILADEAGLLQAPARLFLAVGVLGGFTTFSTFAWGADTLLAHHATASALIYLFASVGGGIAALAAGLLAGRKLVAALERLARDLLGRLEARGLRRHGATLPAMDAVEAEDREDSA